MNETQNTTSSDLDLLVESQLNLQVKISYPEHHDFMIRHQLGECTRVLDVGTGNGSFAACLAEDHPHIQFAGIDKRKHCIDSCKKSVRENLDFQQVDLFARESQFEYSRFDGFLMRYFLLHVDHSKKILALLKAKSKKPARFWIIDLDFSQFNCEPKSKTFDQITNLVKDFCLKNSPDSMAGQNVLPLLKELNYQNIRVENLPFSCAKINIDDLALYIKQEILCYSKMSGKSNSDPNTQEMLRFIDEDFRAGKFKISYGMILLYAELH